MLKRIDHQSMRTAFWKTNYSRKQICKLENSLVEIFDYKICTRLKLDPCKMHEN